jgi:MFS superfamily sulfate permease-like transporter
LFQKEQLPGEKVEYRTNDLTKWEPSATIYTHCEVTLALHLLPLLTPGGSIELGVSKACCWACVVFLELLAKRTGNTIIVSGTHSKTYGGWQYPSGIQEELREPLRNDLLLRAKERLATFLHDLYAMRRASDSQYHSSGDESNSGEGRRAKGVLKTMT